MSGGGEGHQRCSYFMGPHSLPHLPLARTWPQVHYNFALIQLLSVLDFQVISENPPPLVEGTTEQVSIEYVLL